MLSFFFLLSNSLSNRLNFNARYEKNEFLTLFSCKYAWCSIGNVVDTGSIVDHIELECRLSFKKKNLRILTRFAYHNN